MITEKEFKATVKESQSKADVIRKLSLPHYRIYNKYKKQYHVDDSHFTGQAYLKNKTYEDQFGAQTAANIKQKLSIAAIGKCHSHTKETKERLSKSRTEYLENSPHIKWYSLNGINVQGEWEYCVGKRLLDMGFTLDRFSVKYDTHRRYTPDFYIKELNIFIEVKGWFRERDKLKYKKFFIDNPNVKILLIDKNSYKYFIEEKLELKDLADLAQLVDANDLGSFC